MNSKSYFTAVAGDWDDMSSNFFTDRVRDKALDLAKLRKDLVAVDLGAGTGFLTGGLLQFGIQVVAIDQSNAMLSQIAQKYGQADVRCLTGEAHALPLPDGSVDRVLANMYLHHVEVPLTAIREIARVLKPGGRVVITDLDEHQFEFLRREHHDRWLGFDRADIERWFEIAGFVNIKVQDLEETCSSESSSSDDSARINIFAAHADLDSRLET